MVRDKQIERWEGVETYVMDQSAMGTRTQSFSLVPKSWIRTAFLTLCSARTSEAANKKKRGVGRLLSAVSRSASRSGNYDLARTTGDIYSASATADDLSAAAKDLGLTDDDIAACQNP
jgi:hypothetical protein